jgi:hypothetical protein
VHVQQCTTVSGSVQMNETSIAAHKHVTPASPLSGEESYSDPAVNGQEATTLLNSIHQGEAPVASQHSATPSSPKSKESLLGLVVTEQESPKPLDTTQLKEEHDITREQAPIGHSIKPESTSQFTMISELHPQHTVSWTLLPLHHCSSPPNPISLQPLCSVSNFHIPSTYSSKLRTSSTTMVLWMSCAAIHLA